MKQRRQIEASIDIRPATEADIQDLVWLRRMMWEAMGFDDPAQLEAAEAAAATYFGRAIPAGDFHGCLAVTSTGEAVGAGGVVIDPHPPGPTNLSGRIGHIMNLVTAPRYRQRGIARRIMKVIMRRLKERGIHNLSLHATEMGQPLYEELGFVESNEMKLKMQ